MSNRRKALHGDSAVDRAARSILLAGALILSGCIMAAAMETTSLSWLPWISLLPIFITIRVASGRLALFYGALWGFSLYIFSSAADEAAVASNIHSLGLLAAVPAIYVYLGARLTRRIGYAPLILAVGWIMVELALTPTSLSHGLLSGAAGDGGLMRLIGGVLGYVFVAFLIAFVNAQLVSLVNHLCVKQHRGGTFADLVAHCGWFIQNAIVYCSSINIDSLIPRGPPPHIRFRII